MDDRRGGHSKYGGCDEPEMLESHREILQSLFTIAAEPPPRYASGPVSYVPTGHSTDFGYTERGSGVRGPLVTNTPYFYTYIT